MTTLNKNFDGRGVNRVVGMALVPLAPVTALIAETAVLPAAIAGLLFGLLALVSDRFDERTGKMMLALALIGQCIAFTGSLAGHEWQLDSHMLFFAMAAIIATMESVPALLFAVVVTALHHSILGILVPALVYPQNGLLDVLLRTALHASIVTFEVSVLLWTMIRSSRIKAEAEAARDQLARTAAEAEEAQAEAESARETALATADRTREEVQRAAAAVEEIAATARAAADSAAHATAVVARTKSDGEKSGAVVESAMQAMNAIEASSVQISQIITVIDEIARQTDLLALNAAVESARAGEAGRGFAVVANEVRKLAQRSADAAQQIRVLVSTSSNRVVEGVGLVSETGKTMSRIVNAVAELADLMNGIALGASEQSQGLNQVNHAISRLHTLGEGDTGVVSAPMRRMRRAA